MKKFIVVAVATSLVLANGASVAFADHGSGSNDSGSSTGVEGSCNSRAIAAAQEVARRAQEMACRTAQETARKPREDAVAKDRQDQNTNRAKAVLAKYLQALETIETKYRAALVNARRVFEVARKSATSRQAINAAERARNSAVRAADAAGKAAHQKARQIYQDAIKALGVPPARTVKP